MAINKKKAIKLQDAYHAAMPVRNLRTLEDLVELNATLGHENVELFVCEKVCDKLITALRKKGFVVQYLKWKAITNWRLVGISWNVSEFIN